jgi:hypothetical protein
MFEIKIACPNKSFDKLRTKPWKDTPVFITCQEAVFSYDVSEQFTLAMLVAQKIADLFNSEVRWNWQGSPQGHYVSPQDTGGCQFCPGCEIMRDCPAEISQEVNNHVTTTPTT